MMKRKTRPKPKPVAIIQEVKTPMTATTEQKEQTMRELHNSIGFRGWACQESFRQWGNYKGEHPKGE